MVRRDDDEQLSLIRTIQELPAGDAVTIRRTAERYADPDSCDHNDGRRYQERLGEKKERPDGAHVPRAVRLTLETAAQSANPRFPVSFSRPTIRLATRWATVVKTREFFFVSFPPVLVLAGTLWMNAAAGHYERVTDREFYGLAGYHYSVPEWGFRYHPGGEAIHKWTTKVPAATTFLLLGLSLFADLIFARKKGWAVLVAYVALHVVCGAIFFAAAAWFELNVTGVFI